MKEFLVTGAETLLQVCAFFYFLFTVRNDLAEKQNRQRKAVTIRKTEREGGKRARRGELAKAEIFGMLTRNRAASRARGSLMSHPSTQEAEGGHFQQFQGLQVSSSSV